MNITNYLKKNVFASVGKLITVSSVTLLLLPIIIQKIGLDLSIITETNYENLFKKLNIVIIFVKDPS